MAPEELEAMGFDVQLSSHSPDRNCTESNSKYFGIAGKFVQSLVRRRVFRSAWFTDGWPRRNFGFLGGAELIEETGSLLKTPAKRTSSLKQGIRYFTIIFVPRAHFVCQQYVKCANH